MQLAIYTERQEGNHIESTITKEFYQEVFCKIAKNISKAGGSFEDTKDIVHDALIIYHEKKSASTNHGIINNLAYIQGIAKILWIRKSKDKMQYIPMQGIDKVTDEDFFPAVNIERVKSYLLESGEKCLQILRAFYFQQMTIGQIVDQFNYANKRSASTQKYKCLQKLRKSIQNKAMHYEDFLQ